MSWTPETTVATCKYQTFQLRCEDLTTWFLSETFTTKTKSIRAWKNGQTQDDGCVEITHRGSVLDPRVDNAVMLPVNAKDSVESKSYSSQMLFVCLCRNVKAVQPRSLQRRYHEDRIETSSLFSYHTLGSDSNCITKVQYVSSVCMSNKLHKCLSKLHVLKRGHTGVFTSVAHILLLELHNPNGYVVICCQKHGCVNPVCIFFFP